MNDEEAQYRFRRTVAEVLKTIADPEEPVAAHPAKEFDVTVDHREGRDDDD
jgi:hypothetical protein